MIDRDVLKIMYRLINFGHQVFLVGGSVRDILLDIEPKDFDLSTDAPPQRIRKLFRNSRIIGRRFKINHIYFHGNKIIETTTFRAPEELDKDEDQPIASDNTYGDAESDAFRRDLTINALFYDLKTFSIIDYVGGVEDIENKVIRLIGDPEQRIIADPVRMIRAVRHAARTGFEIEEKTKTAIINNAELILNSSKARVYEELARDLKRGKAAESFTLFKELGLLQYLLPVISEAITNGAWKSFVKTLGSIDDYVASHDKEPSTAVIFTAISYDVLAKTSALDEFSESARASIGQLLSAVVDGFIEDSKLPVKKIEVVLSKVFKPLGVSNKDREEMMDLILTRYDMFQVYHNQEDPRMITRRHHFEHAVDLLKLTSIDKKSKECMAYWVDVAKGRTEEEKKKTYKPRPPRRRRRRPRRKKDE